MEQTYYQRNRQRLLEKQKEYYHRNKDAIKSKYDPEKAAQRYAANKEAILAKRKAEYAAKREQAIEYSKAYYQRHREAILERARQSYEQNREAILEESRQRRQQALEERAKTDPKAAKTLWMSSLTPTLKAVLRRRRNRQRAWARKVLKQGFQLTFWDAENKEEITMSVADAARVLSGENDKNEKI